MRLFTLQAAVTKLDEGIELPVIDPTQALKVRPELSPFIVLGEQKPHSQHLRVPVAPELMPTSCRERRIYDAELKRTRPIPTSLSSAEAHGFEFCPTEDGVGSDRSILVLIDTRGSRHQPNCVAGWKKISGCSENLLVARHRSGISGRLGLCHIGLVRMHPGSELMVRAEGGGPFLLLYPGVEDGLLCDLDGLQNRNHLTAQERHARRDERRIARLQEQTRKRDEYRRRNEGDQTAQLHA